VRLLRTGVKNRRAEVRNAAVFTSLVRFFQLYFFQWIPTKTKKHTTQQAKILKKMSSS
jgi:hypothetical protein